MNRKIKEFEAVFWHEIGHLVANLCALKEKNEYYNHDIQINKDPEYDQNFWGFTKSKELDDVFFSIGELIYGPIFESLHYKINGNLQDENIFIECWYALTKPEENHKRDITKVQKLVESLNIKFEDIRIELNWIAKEHNKQILEHDNEIKKMMRKIKGVKYAKKTNNGFTINIEKLKIDFLNEFIERHYTLFIDFKNKIESLILKSKRK